MATIKMGIGTKAYNRLRAQLSFGRYLLENNPKDKSLAFDLKTYYLLRDGRVVCYREWYQMNRPDYLMTGSKQGCQNYWNKRPATSF